MPNLFIDTYAVMSGYYLSYIDLVCFICGEDGVVKKLFWCDMEDDEDRKVFISLCKNLGFDVNEENIYDYQEEITISKEEANQLIEKFKNKERIYA